MKPIDFQLVKEIERRGGLCPHTMPEWRTCDALMIAKCDHPESHNTASDIGNYIVTSISDYCTKEDWERCLMNKGGSR